MDPREVLKKLRAKIAVLAVKADLTEDETKELDSMTRQAEALKAQIKALEIVEEGQEEERQEAEAERQKEIDAAVKAALEKKEKEEAEKRRLPDRTAPDQTEFHELAPYDHLSVEDHAVLAGVLQAAKRDNRSQNGISEAGLRSLAIKLAENKERVGVVAQRAMKAAGVALKADEVMQQDLTGFGDEWVGVAYSQALWEAIRTGTFVAARLPSIEVPPGHESVVIPLEGADPTFYKVAETTDNDSTMLFPVASVTSSKMATGSKTLSLAKMGARVLWSGELEEDSLIPFVAQLRRQLETAGQEQLEHAIIDGDTAAGASANINDIAGTPAATDLFLLFNGFRKSPLVTTTANSRSAAGSLVANDYLETVKLMGTAGINALNKQRVEFIVDVNTHWKSLELDEVKTRDVFSQPTIENGMLTGIWGYRVNTSAFMHYKDSDRLANTAGKIDVDTVSNNTTGAILAVRWDQWLLGYHRRMTIETQRIARSDVTEIVALMRLGLAQRDTEASAISYNVGI